MHIACYVRVANHTAGYHPVNVTIPMPRPMVTLAPTVHLSTKVALPQTKSWMHSVKTRCNSKSRNVSRGSKLRSFARTSCIFGAASLSRWRS
jgi:hypothetical protein